MPRGNGLWILMEKLLFSLRMGSLGGNETNENTIRKNGLLRKWPKRCSSSLCKVRGIYTQGTADENKERQEVKA